VNLHNDRMSDLVYSRYLIVELFICTSVSYCIVYYHTLTPLPYTTACYTPQDHPQLGARAAGPRQHNILFVHAYGVRELTTRGPGVCDRGARAGEWLCMFVWGVVLLAVCVFFVLIWCVIFVHFCALWWRDLAVNTMFLSD